MSGLGHLISRGPLAYNAEEACRLLSMIILDATGNFGNGSDSQIIGKIENLGYCTGGSHPDLFMFGIIRRDPETVLVPPTTTRIPDRTSRAGTERTRLFRLLLTVRAQSVRSHAVTSSPIFRIRI